MRLIFLLLVFFVTSIGRITAQNIPKEMFNYQLKRVVAQCEKKLMKGDSAHLLVHADALFSLNESEKAMALYTLADKRKMEFSAIQKRNYIHTASRLGQISPYHKRSNYFVHELPLVVQISEVPVNSLQEDLAPFYRDGKLLFSSSRASKRSKNKFKYTLTGLNYLDYVLMDTLGNSYPLSGLPAGLQTDLHDGAIFLNKDSTLLFVSRTRLLPGPDGIHQQHIAYFERKNGIWSRAKDFPHNSLNYSVQHPWYDDQNCLLYFAADNPDDSSGFDIYKSSFNNGQWGMAVRLGDSVNSEYDEVFPSLNPDGNLFYATNHPETNGGLDLVMVKDGKRYLLPNPLNTRFDDFGIAWSGDWKGFFTSNRTGLAFNDDIYSFVAEFKVEPKINQYVIIRLPQSDSSLTWDKIKLSIKSSHNSTYQSVRLTDSILLLGSYTAPLPIWEIQISGIGIMPLNTKLSFSSQGKSSISIIELEKAKPVLESKGFLSVYFQNGQPSKLSNEDSENIDYRRYFNLYMKAKPVYLERSGNSPTEVESFFSDLEKGMASLEIFPSQLDTVLKTGRKMRVYMASHTSTSGTIKINKEISERRGRVLKNYIIKWNNGALKEYIENGQLIVSDAYFPVSSEIVNKPKSKNINVTESPEFGMTASRERRVNVVWETME